MFPSFCGAMGFAGWLLMVVLWAGLVALVVWAVARLFPDRSVPAEPPPPLPPPPAPPPHVSVAASRAPTSSPGGAEPAGPRP
ncbi:MAG TPA: hypothetical protein VFM54_05755 [Micromonosporaceae bacterium]|nr:hypothetical protein [Micromonosporaceae bacterium]